MSATEIEQLLMYLASKAGMYLYYDIYSIHEVRSGSITNGMNNQIAYFSTTCEDFGFTLWYKGKTSKVTNRDYSAVVDMINSIL